MSAESHPSYTDPTRVFHNFDEDLERRIGADMRLIYGMLVPILMICGLIILLALNPQTWVVIIVLVFELVALGVVITGFMGMLNESDTDDAEVE
jgi:hypothetical protein